MQVFDSLQDDRLSPAIKSGSVGVMPTDTVYGLVCVAANQPAVTRVYALESRKHNPGTVIAADIDQLVTLGLKRRYLNAVTQFWPGQVSVIIPIGLGLDYLRLGMPGLAVRIPGDETLQRLLVKTGPLLTTSVAKPGEPVANTIKEAQGYFGEAVDFYVEGGDVSGRLPSTLIRVVDDAIEVVRQGAVTV